jgi:hypothetical protein
MWILIGVIVLIVLGVAFGASYEALSTLAAFGVASLAVQSWRELGVLVAIAAALYLPIKWLAGALAPGSWFAADCLTVHDRGISFHLSGAAMLAIMLAAVTMILWRHFAIVRAERRG